MDCFAFEGVSGFRGRRWLCGMLCLSECARVQGSGAGAKSVDCFVQESVGGFRVQRFRVKRQALAQWNGLQLSVFKGSGAGAGSVNCFVSERV